MKRVSVGRLGRLRGEGGDVAPLVVLTTITVFMVMFVVQLGLFFHARTVVNAAAQDGLRAAQLEGGTGVDAKQAAQNILAGSSGLLSGQVVNIEYRSSTEVEVRISADVTSLVPFWDGSITSTAVGPVEQFRPEGER